MREKREKEKKERDEKRKWREKYGEREKKERENHQIGTPLEISNFKSFHLDASEDTQTCFFFSVSRAQF